jgi:hypothetical protein
LKEVQSQTGRMSDDSQSQSDDDRCRCEYG